MSTRNELGWQAASLTRIAVVLSVCVVIFCLFALAPASSAKAAPAASGPAKPAAAQPAEPPSAAPAEAEKPPEPKPLAAPKYLEGSKSVDKKYEKTWNKVRQDVIKILASGKFEAGQQQVMEDYYRRWVLPRMTVEENYSSLPKQRSDLSNELRRGSSGPPLTTAVTLILDTMSKVARANFHPAVRCNAMLIIGDLNERESPNPTIQPPVPLPAALPVMLNALKDEKQIDEVQIAALVGLARHARLGIADQQLVAQQLTPELLKLAEMKAPPANRSTDGHEWMRCMAIDLLGILRSVGPESKVLKALAGIIADRKEPLGVRGAAARALGSLDYAGAAGSPSELGTALGQLAQNACGAEMDATDQLITSRRRLRVALHSVVIGLGTDDQRGVRSWGREAPHKDFLDKLNERIQALTTPFDRKDIEDPDLFKEVSKGVIDLATFLQNAPGAAPGAGPPAEAAKPAAEPAK